MALITAGQIADEKSVETLEERFRRLENVWIKAVGHFSSPTVLLEHPAFHEIISLGSPVVPLMIRDLADRPRLWVYALEQITGVNPVPKADRGDIRKMSEAWLLWAKANGQP